MAKVILCRITGSPTQVIAYAEQRGLFNPLVHDLEREHNVTVVRVNDTEYNNQVLRDWEASAIMFHDEKSLGRPVSTADLPMGTLLEITKGRL